MNFKRRTLRLLLVGLMLPAFNFGISGNALAVQQSPQVPSTTTPRPHNGFRSYDGLTSTTVRPYQEDAILPGGLQDPSDDLQNALEGINQLPEVPQAPSSLTREINEENLGWNEAGLGSGDQRVGLTIRAHWVMLDENGTLNGQVQTVQGVAPEASLRVFVLRKGLVVGESITNELGQFEIEGLEPSVYSLVGYSSSHIIPLFTPKVTTWWKRWRQI